VAPGTTTTRGHYRDFELGTKITGGD
jgi:hypothetical protein